MTIITENTKQEYNSVLTAKETDKMNKGMNVKRNKEKIKGRRQTRDLGKLDVVFM